jgi:hypothetical protein
MTGNRPPPKLSACFLYEKVDRKGRKYLKGKMGGLSVLVVENKDPNIPNAAPFSLHFAAPFPGMPDGEEQD